MPQHPGLPAVAVRALSLVLMPLLLLLIAGCATDSDTPEQQIRATLAAVADAVESGALRDAADRLHPDYGDTRHLNKAAAMRSLLGYTRRHSRIHLFRLIQSVEVAEDQASARARVHVAMTAVPVDSVETLHSIRADLYRFDLQLRRDGSEWLITWADWQRAALDDLL